MFVSSIVFGLLSFGEPGGDEGAGKSLRAAMLD